ncbi:MAG: response regulator transcription factor [Rhodothermia bacterium]|nr:MAG: response regulator transcription factor [Rhodothermia bacterium]
MTRILVVDDHPLMRKGLIMSLSDDPDVEVCAQASNAEEAMSLVELESPDLVIVDISLPGMSGLELIKQLHAIRPELYTLVVSRHDESLYAERAIRAGARGYVMKLEAGNVMTKAVHRVLSGGIYVSEEINEKLLMGMAAGHTLSSHSPLDVLSDRELEVFELTGKGSGTREISERLHLSVKTVESYRARIKTKLNLSTTSELMQHAVHWVEGEGAR